MIRLKNIAELEESVFVSGPMAVLNDATSVVVPFNGIISAILFRVTTAGVTGTANVDVKVIPAATGVAASIFASSAAAVQFASGAVTATYGALATPNPVVLAKGDMVRLDVTAIHTTPARGLAGYIAFRRRRIGYGQNATEIDTVSTQSDLL